MKRILVIDNNTLIGAGIQYLLMNNSSFEVHGFAPETVSDLLSCIKQIQPQIVIIDRALPFISASDLWALLQQPRDLCLFEVSANTPYTRIFSKHLIWLTRSTNLTSMINWSTNQITLTEAGKRVELNHNISHSFPQ